MSENEDEYGFLNNIDQKVFISMVILTVALVAGAIWMNIATRSGEECTSAKYIYCGEKEGHGAPH